MELDETCDCCRSFDGEAVCAECRERKEQYASTIVHIAVDGDVHTTIFDERFVYLDDDERYDGLPGPVVERIWRSIDAQSGYYDHALAKGYVEVSAGWVTGYPDETVPHKWDVAEFYEKLKEGELKPPRDLWWAFAPTSNFYATAATVICHSQDLDTVNEWLAEQNADLERWLG